MIVNKENPFLAPLLERRLLNKAGSSKETYHVTLDIQGSGIVYHPGDCAAVFPENDPHLVSLIEHKLGTPAFRDLLLKKANLSRVTGRFLEHVCHASFSHERDKITYLQSKNLLQVLSDYPVDLEAFPLYLSPLLPRFYSIASYDPHSIDLLIRTFDEAPGLASDFICKRPLTHVPLYLHPTSHFRLPENSATPIIMIGPGTGVAPFRSFLTARLKSPGKNWLFFGERSRYTDFYYESFFLSHPNLKLTCAFSRDQADKVYVQHKMLEHKLELKAWIEEGALIYLCGDARRMAKDVQNTLKEILEVPDLKALRKNKQLLLDVY